MSYTKPFQVRAPDFSQIRYAVMFPDADDALATLSAISNKLPARQPDGSLELPLGRRMRCREEAVSGGTLTFLSQLRTADVSSGAALVEALEAELLAVTGTGSITEKTVLE